MCYQRIGMANHQRIGLGVMADFIIASPFIPGEYGRLVADHEAYARRRIKAGVKKPVRPRGARA